MNPAVSTHSSLASWWKSLLTWQTQKSEDTSRCDRILSRISDGNLEEGGAEKTTGCDSRRQLATADCPVQVAAVHLRLFLLPYFTTVALHDSQPKHHAAEGWPDSLIWVLLQRGHVTSPRL